jgi:cell division protein FtsQ
MPKVGWDTYKSINLKYANQIVCEKNTIDTNKIVAEISRPLTDSIKLENQESTKN